MRNVHDKMRQRFTAKYLCRASKVSSGPWPTALPAFSGQRMAEFCADVHCVLCAMETMLFATKFYDVDIGLALPFCGWIGVEGGGYSS